MNARAQHSAGTWGGEGPKLRGGRGGGISFSMIASMVDAVEGLPANVCPWLAARSYVSQGQERARGGQGCWGNSHGAEGVPTPMRQDGRWPAQHAPMENGSTSVVGGGHPVPVKQIAGRMWLADEAGAGRVQGIRGFRYTNPGAPASWQLVRVPLTALFPRSRFCVLTTAAWAPPSPLPRAGT